MLLPVTPAAGRHPSAKQKLGRAQVWLLLPQDATETRSMNKAEKGLEKKSWQTGLSVVDEHDALGRHPHARAPGEVTYCCNSHTPP